MARNFNGRPAENSEVVHGKREILISERVPTEEHSPPYTQCIIAIDVLGDDSLSLPPLSVLLREFARP